MSFQHSFQAQPGRRQRDVDDDNDEDALFVTQATDNRSYATADVDEDSDAIQSEASGQDLNEISEPATDEGDIEDSAYNERSEPYPRCAAYDPRFVQVQERLITLASSARAVLDGQMCDTDAVERLQVLASDAASIPEARREMIGLLGDTGAGMLKYPCGAMAELTITREKLLHQLLR